MRRILVIGLPGAGKSTLSVELGERLGLPVYHLDKLFWQPGWVMTPHDEWDRTVSDLVTGERWIIDGSFDRNLAIRLARADTVIFLDFPTPLCLYRAIRRVLGSYGRQRPDMGDGCAERWDWEFMKFIWHYRRDRMPRMLRLLEQHRSQITLITLRNPSETDRFLDSLARSAPG